MNYSQIAQRYARALFELAVEQGLVDETMSDMRQLSRIASSDQSFKSILRSPVIRPHIKMKVASALFAKDFTPLSMKFIDLIIRKGRSLFIDAIASEYVEIAKIHKGILSVNLQSAAPMQEMELKNMTDQLAKASGFKIELDSTINPNLIGGFIVSFSGRRFDYSVRERLNKISKEFKMNIYEKGF